MKRQGLFRKRFYRTLAVCAGLAILSCFAASCGQNTAPAPACTGSLQQVSINRLQEIGAAGTVVFSSSYGAYSIYAAPSVSVDSYLLYQLYSIDAAGTKQALGEPFHCEPETCLLIPFDDLMGYQGFCFYSWCDSYTGYAKYYGVTDDGIFLLAESASADVASESGNPDYFVDIDGDGTKELVCNVLFSDGAQNVTLFRSDGTQILTGFGDDLLDKAYDNVNYMSEYSHYLPDEQVIEIFYWLNSQQTYERETYAIEPERINWYPYENATLP